MSTRQVTLKMRSTSAVHQSWRHFSSARDLSNSWNNELFSYSTASSAWKERRICGPRCETWTGMWTSTNTRSCATPRATSSKVGSASFTANTNTYVQGSILEWTRTRKTATQCSTQSKNCTRTTTVASDRSFFWINKCTIVNNDANHFIRRDSINLTSLIILIIWLCRSKLISQLPPRLLLLVLELRGLLNLAILNLLIVTLLRIITIFCWVLPLSV